MTHIWRNRMHGQHGFVVIQMNDQLMDSSGFFGFFKWSSWLICIRFFQPNLKLKKHLKSLLPSPCYIYVEWKHNHIVKSCRLLPHSSHMGKYLVIEYVQVLSDTIIIQLQQKIMKILFINICNTILLLRNTTVFIVYVSINPMVKHMLVHDWSDIDPISQPLEVGFIKLKVL